MKSLGAAKDPRSQAIFLDRDGVINYDIGFVHRRADFLFLPGVVRALASLPPQYKKVIVSNQSGVGRGLFSLEAVENLNRWMLKQLLAEGVEINAILLCPHSPSEDCGCRKPKPGLFLQAQRTLGLDFKGSWVIGDKESDIRVGKRLGCGTIVVNKNRVERAGPGKIRADFVAPGLKEAVAIILSHPSAD